MQKRVDRIAAPMDAVFPNAEVDTEVAERDTLEPVSPYGAATSSSPPLQHTGRDYHVQHN
jgi:hypothetical protein